MARRTSSRRRLSKSIARIVTRMECIDDVDDLEDASKRVEELFLSLEESKKLSEQSRAFCARRLIAPTGAKYSPIDENE